MKIYATLISAVFILAAASCTKTDSISDTQDSIKLLENTECFSQEFNPFDSSSIHLGAVFSENLGIIDSTMDDPLSVIESRVKLCDSIFKHNHLQIGFDDSLSEIELAVYLDFFALISVESLSDMSHFINGVYTIEYEIVNSELDSLRKSRALAAISMMKYTYYYFYLLGSEYSIYRTWEERVSSCIRTELDNIFVYGDIWDQAQFIAGIPGSFAWIVGKCHWIATFGPGAISIPEVSLAVSMENTCFETD